MNLSNSTEFIESLTAAFPSLENNFDTLKITVPSSEWIETVNKLKNDFDLTYFCFVLDFLTRSDPRGPDLSLFCFLCKIGFWCSLGSNTG